MSPDAADPADGRHGSSDDPPGRLIDIGTHRLHLRCAGAGGPPVVFDAALGASSVSWTFVQPRVAAATRACSYDRAGFAWSDPGPFPRTAGRMAAELRDLLHRAAVPAPIVLVGHSFGGMVAQVYAGRYRDEVAGLVLVDPAHPEDWLAPSPVDRSRIDRGVRLCRYGARAARFGVASLVARLVASGALAPARALVRLASRGGLQRQDEAILAPMWKLPPDDRRVLPSFWTRPRFYEALGSQIAHVCESAADVLEARGDGFGDLPLAVISPAGLPDARRRRQTALAGLSTRGREVMAATTGHWVPLDDPETVARTVLDIVRAASGGEMMYNSV